VNDYPYVYLCSYRMYVSINSINVDEMMGMNWHLLSPIAPHLTLMFSLFDSMG
jgi:hypothetical protein